MDSRALYFRRSLQLRTGDAGSIVYVVWPSPTKRDPVPVIGAFPRGWRPTDFPGQVLWFAESKEQYFSCQVPRSQFRHYTLITENEALAIYPKLRSHLAHLAPE